MLWQRTAVKAAATDEAISLRPTDRIALAYAIALAVVAAICRVPPPSLLPAIAAFAAGVVAVARFASVSRVGRVVHDFAAIPFVIALFELSAPVVAAVNPTRWDAQLAALDRVWFGALPAAWVGLWGRPEWLTEAASILYASYYPIPIAIAVTLYRRGRRAEFESFVFAVVATFLASYVSYILAPAFGPREPATREVAFGGYAVSTWLQSFLQVAEWNQLDAFPSGHVALALVYLVLGSRMLPRWRLPLAALTAGIVFSTVYLSLHYVVDLLAGAVVGAVMLPASSALYRVLDQRPSS